MVRSRPPKTSADVRPSCPRIAVWRGQHPRWRNGASSNDCRANAATFLNFLRMLKERYPDRLIVLVLDHARIQLVEMAERHRDRQCVSQTSKRYRPGHCSVCGRHPRTSAGSAATLRVCRMTEKSTLHVACI